MKIISNGTQNQENMRIAAGTTGTNIGPDGVLQIFPTIHQGAEVYLKDDPPKDKFNVSYGTNSHIPYEKKTEGELTYFNSTGHAITYGSGQTPGRSLRLDMYPDGGIWSNDTDFSWNDNPGYLYTEKGIDNGEYTIYIRPHGDLGTHQAAAWKLGGRDEDDIRSLFEICGADQEHNEPFSHWNYEHFPYVKCPTTVFKPYSKLQEDKWYALKAVRIVDSSKKFCDFYLFEDPDPIDENGKPRNQWRLIAHAHDKGTDDYSDDDGNPVPCTWKSHKDLFRTDGYENWDFALMSIRNIDPTATPAIPLKPI